MRRAPSRASSSRLRPADAPAVVAIALRSGILCMGGVSFLAPRGRTRSLQPEGYAAFFMPPVHNLRVYLRRSRRALRTWLFPDPLGPRNVVIGPLRTILNTAPPYSSGRE